ncbi:DsbA family protein [Mesorhizobium sp. VK25A]|uniref:DsbA family protein n=1 Tax=Mesorhizobium vachelliae TaxID=3072309 RepID=A0ABU4ZZE3_9HYPH|nr:MULTISPECIES: DsbA family protein [unclassified Mesorhizobium]MDX8530332.1 DsbA family protein [Mesorhizobium sp. VK25D]MDX8542309.1 DsbA family protein [Mesorhizobium sp. VK25A]
MRITYLFDPLCGWCYGASPVVEKLSQLDGVTLNLAPTGLFAGDASRPMDSHFAAYAWQNDQRIARLTSQPFSEAYREQVLGSTGGLFDSAPATLGLVAAGLTEPAHELEALKALQRARYQDGRNNSDLKVVAEILAELGFTEAARRLQSPDEELLDTYRNRVSAARADMARFGAEGVPALIVDRDGDQRLMRASALFGAFDALASQLHAA